MLLVKLLPVPVLCCSEVEQQQDEVVRESRERSPARGQPVDEDEEERPVSASSRHRSIAEEVRRLMEEQEEEQREVKAPLQQPPGNRAKARKRQVRELGEMASPMQRGVTCTQ